jgi:two-component system sensor histidine kinase KdpD
VLKRADEVVNVDVSVETLRSRLRQGKIYDAAKIEQSLTNFFRKGNLTALRELALRQLASDQAGKAQDYRSREGLGRPVIPEKVMVAMASRGSAKTLLRVGSRIAGRLATDWFAVYVETPKEGPGRIKPEDHVALQDNIRFAKQLGAQVVKLNGSRVADLLVEFARREGITHVIFGQSARSRWDLLMRGSIVDRFLRDVRNATVQIVPVRDGPAGEDDALDG